MINYTWSHSIDNASDGQDYVANATQPDNSYRADLERGNSNFDNRHRFVATASYSIPNFARAHPRLGAGWQLNTVVTLRSGNPFHLTLLHVVENQARCVAILSHPQAHELTDVLGAKEASEFDAGARKVHWKGLRNR